MDEDPYLGWGLRPVELADRAVLDSYFTSLTEPLSDYTFSQLFTWRKSLKILWKLIDGHLCVFANGSGDLTLLMPPIGDTASDRALKEAFELMDAFNVAHGVPDRTRVEYASAELLSRFSRTGMQVRPMGADYVYDVQRMIDLAGGDLASKRQAKNRFLRNYEHRVEPYEAARHREDCLALLETWKIHQDAQHLEEPNASSIKRSKESIAAALCLESSHVLGMEGLVVYVKGTPTPECPDPGWSLRAFTFGEWLGAQQSSITIEKTDLAVKGLAQFIFSEFCRVYWSGRPLVNVGDDWGLESLAWTKQSYRPVKMLEKYVLRPEPAILSPTGIDLRDRSAAANLAPAAPEPVHAPRPVTIRPAQKEDLDATLQLERATFSEQDAISKRQMLYLQQRDTAIFLVAEQGENIVGDGIALVRAHKGRLSGRIYSLVVRPDHRGQKIGHRLLGSLLEELGTRGVTRVYLEVDQTNAGAIRLYEQTGFRRIGLLPGYYGEGKDAIHMMYEAPKPREAALQIR